MRDVPLFDLTRQYEVIREDVLEAIDEAIKSGKLILGPKVKAFEQKMAEISGVRYGVGVANGSDALYIALKALGIGEGDYVITSPFTFFATASCITRNGATPIFADIDPETFNLDLDQVEEILKTHKKSDRIKAILPVHIFGQTMDLERLATLREAYGVEIVEDCAQSVGSLWKMKNGKSTQSGSLGKASTFSFFPTKNLGGYGDGGMIVSDDKETAEHCAFLRKHGARKKYFHDEIGINSRFDELQAAVLLVKFKYLEEYITERIRVAYRYDELFREKGLAEFLDYPSPVDDRTHVFHQYVIRVKKGSRDGLRAFLKDRGVGSSIYYPKPLHLQPCFDYLGYEKGELPVAEKACDEVLALPVFPELRGEEVEVVVEWLAEYFKSNR